MGGNTIIVVPTVSKDIVGAFFLLSMTLGGAELCQYAYKMIYQ